MKKQNVSHKSLFSVFPWIPRVSMGGFIERNGTPLEGCELLLNWCLISNPYSCISLCFISPLYGSSCNLVVSDWILGSAIQSRFTPACPAAWGPHREKFSYKIFFSFFFSLKSTYSSNNSVLHNASAGARQSSEITDSLNPAWHRRLRRLYGAVMALLSSAPCLMATPHTHLITAVTAPEIYTLSVISNMSYFITRTKRAHSHDVKGAG